jgi:hypothetical protein
LRCGAAGRADCHARLLADLKVTLSIRRHVRVGVALRDMGIKDTAVQFSRASSGDVSKIFVGVAFVTRLTGVTRTA